MYTVKELINIYEFFVKSEKIKELDIYNLISILMFSVSESPDSNNIESLCSNLDNLLKLINKGFHEKNESYYKLFIYYLMKENEKKMKNIKCIYLLEDDKLFIKSSGILISLSDRFVSSDLDKFENSFENLTNESLDFLREKILKNDWIKETLIYVFEQISIIYMQKEEIYHKENKIKKVVLISRIGFCAEFLENYKKEEQKDILIIKKLFAISYIRVYLKIFVDKIDNNKARRDN